MFNCTDCLCNTDVDIQLEMAKLKNLSLMSKDELQEAFRVTFCYRRLLIQQKHPAFMELVEQTPTYLTFPQVVCH